jgi:CRISPR-associated endoribonuclease Cas6
MPHSLVLNLSPISPIPQGYLTGKHLHALFLTLVSLVDQTLGDRLHEQKTEKPFTLSPLQTSRQSNAELQWDYRHSIPAGQPCWWRISLLDDTLFGHLSKLWLNLNPSQPWHSSFRDQSPNFPQVLYACYFSAGKVRFCTPHARLHF